MAWQRSRHATQAVVTTCCQYDNMGSKRTPVGWMGCESAHHPVTSNPQGRNPENFVAAPAAGEILNILISIIPKKKCHLSKPIHQKGDSLGFPSIVVFGSSTLSHKFYYSFEKICWHCSFIHYCHLAPLLYHHPRDTENAAALDIDMRYDLGPIQLWSSSKYDALRKYHRYMLKHWDGSNLLNPQLHKHG